MLPSRLSLSGVASAGSVWPPPGWAPDGPLRLLQMKKEPWSDQGTEMAKQGPTNGSDHYTARAPDDFDHHDKLDSVYNLPVTADRTAKWCVTRCCAPGYCLHAPHDRALRPARPARPWQQMRGN